MADPIRPTLEALAAGDVLARLDKLEAAQKAPRAQTVTTATHVGNEAFAPAVPRKAGPRATHKT